MGINVTLNTDLSSAQKWLTRIASNQASIAANSLTQLAVEVKDYQRDQMSRDIDRPSPFTKNSMVSYRASQRRLESGVFVKDRQAEYLSRLVNKGATIRRPKTKAVFIPAKSQQTNRYGNMPRGRRRTALSSPTYTRRNANGGAAVYRRVGNSSERLGTFVQAAKYKGVYWPFYENSIVYAGRNFGRIWGRQWDNAVRTFS